MVASLVTWVFIFMAHGARGENWFDPAGIRTLSALYYPFQYLYSLGYVAGEDEAPSAPPVLVPAFPLLFPLNKITQGTYTRLLMEEPSESRIGNHNYLITQPINTKSESVPADRLIENIIQYISINGKNPFSSNKILLLKDAQFFRSYYNIYIYIYTNFDDVETLESLKNIDILVPRVNLTVRTGTK